MQKKLTISINEKTYAGLHAVIGRGNIGRFLEQVAKPYLFPDDLAASYREMASDASREAHALEWIEALTADATDAAR
jgi:hypothetical protein